MNCTSNSVAHTRLRVLMLALNVDALQMAGPTLPPTQTWSAPQTSAWANNTHARNWGSWCWSWMLMYCNWQVTHSLPHRHELHLKPVHGQTTHTHTLEGLDAGVERRCIANGRLHTPSHADMNHTSNLCKGKLHTHTHAHTHTHLRVLMLTFSVSAPRRAAHPLLPRSTWFNLSLVSVSVQHRPLQKR